MAILIQSATPVAVTAANSITISLSGVTVGSKVTVHISWIDTHGAIQLTPTAPTGFTAASAPGSTAAAGGVCGANIYEQIAAGSSVSAVFNAPSGVAAQLYAYATMCEWNPMVNTTFDKAATPVTNNSAASTTTGTVGPTATLTQANEVVITAGAWACSTGVTNATIGTPSGYTSIGANQNTSTTVGAIHAYKEVSATTGVSAVHTWSSDSSMLTYQLVAATFEETGGGGGAVKGPLLINMGGI